MKPRASLDKEIRRRIMTQAAEHRQPRQHVGQVPRPETSPIYPASVYAFSDLDEIRDYYDKDATTSAKYLYQRNGHPNEVPVAAIVAALEQAEAATLFSSGMAAIAQSCFALLHPGDHVLATRHLYGGTYAFFEQTLRPWGVEITYIDLNDSLAMRKNLKEQTRMVYAETIANPLLQVCNLEDVGIFAKRHRLQLLVDNTFATPFLVRPLEYGATLSIHSLTKFLNGHSDVVGGAIAGDEKTVAKVRQFAVTFGGTMAPFDAWLTERGLQTFELRYPQQCETAFFLAHVLAAQPAVRTVYYPGREQDPSHFVAQRVFSGGYGAVVSFELRGGYAEANQFVRGLQTIHLAPSLGGLHTTLSHPALTSHRAFTQEQREQLGIGDGLLRLSVGCESYDLLEEELSRAFEPLNKRWQTERIGDFVNPDVEEFVDSEFETPDRFESRDTDDPGPQVQ